jgi:hypothetical protein
MSKKFFVVALSLFALTSLCAQSARAQQSCAALESFGFRETLAVNKALQSQLEVTYFTTDDANAFMSEKAGLNRSGSYLSLNSNQFVAKLEALERNGLASIRKQHSVTSYLGETAQLNLERNSLNARGMINASHASNTKDLSALDRKTEINVYEGRAFDGGFYRLSLLSWFVQSKGQGVERVVDYDAIVLLKPGQTAVFKLASKYELKRSGATRSYVAVTMRSVNPVSLAAANRRR